MKLYALFTSLAALGLAILFMNAELPTTPWSSLWTAQIASVLLIGGVFGLLDKAFLNRHLHPMVAALFGVHEASVKTGMVAAFRDSKDHDFSEMIRNSKSLKPVLNDGRTWVFSRITGFQRQFSERCDTELFLVDPDGPALPILAAKTGYSVPEQKDKIRQTATRVREEFVIACSKGFLRIRQLRYYPTHSVFLGSDSVAITLYGISSGRRAVPLLLFQKGPRGESSYWDIYDDVEGMKGEGVCLFDSGAGQGTASSAQTAGTLPAPTAPGQGVAPASP